MMTRVIVTEEDLLPVEFNEETRGYKCDNFVTSEEVSADVLRLRALRQLSISEDMKKRELEEAKIQHERWIVEKILPLSLVMYKKYQDDYISEERWMEHYLNKNSVTLRWIKTAEVAHKHLNPEDKDK